VTFLSTRYRLVKPPTAKELERLGRLSTRYGIRGLSLEDKDLVVEYDASRIHEAEVLSELRSAGIPIEPQKAIPPGAFDYSGQFKDFAWPMQGLTPVNVNQK
jgi:hypothetical protein